MRVVTDFYYNDLEQRCSNEECTFMVGAYSDEWFGNFCPWCSSPLQYFRAFGTLEQRSKPVQRWQGRISGLDY